MSQNYITRGLETFLEQLQVVMGTLSAPKAYRLLTRRLPLPLLHSSCLRLSCTIKTAM